MIALPRIRGFSAGNWQIPLTDNLNAAVNGVYMARTYFGAEQTAGPFSKADFVLNRIRQQAVVQDATSAMNKPIGGIGAAN